MTSADAANAVLPEPVGPISATDPRLPCRRALRPLQRVADPVLGRQQRTAGQHPARAASAPSAGATTATASGATSSGRASRASVRCPNRRRSARRPAMRRHSHTSPTATATPPARRRRCTTSTAAGRAARSPARPTPRPAAGRVPAGPRPATSRRSRRSPCRRRRRSRRPAGRRATGDAGGHHREPAAISATSNPAPGSRTSLAGGHHRRRRHRRRGTSRPTTGTGADPAATSTRLRCRRWRRRRCRTGWSCSRAGPVADDDLAVHQVIAASRSADRSRLGADVVRLVGQPSRVDFGARRVAEAQLGQVPLAASAPPGRRVAAVDDHGSELVAVASATRTSAAPNRAPTVPSAWR